MAALATAQTRALSQGAEDLRTLSAFWNAACRLHAKSAVELGAIVRRLGGERAGTEERTYILCGRSGTELTGPGGDGFLSVITPASPVGRALIGRRAG